MNESDTRLHKIDPQLKAAGWGVTEGSRITTEYLTRGKISKTQKGKPKRADYVLHLNVYNPIAIVEAKDNNHSVSFGLQQAITYARMLDIPFQRQRHIRNG